jgi:hypothetical protein
MNGSYDGVIARINQTGTAFIFGTYFGGANLEFGNGVDVDADGNIYAVGHRRYPNLDDDAWMLKLDPTGMSFLHTHILFGPDATNWLSVAVAWDGSNVAATGNRTTRWSDPPFPLRIAAATTRWRPQRSTTGTVDIRFTSASPLKSATVTVSGPSPVAPIQATFDPTNPPNPYVMTWQGPWLTDPTDPTSFLSRGDYRISITGVKQDDTTEQSHAADPNSTVSLVETASVRLEAVAGGAALTTNPAVGPVPAQTPPQTRPQEGKRLFAEAESLSGPPKRRIRVAADVSPLVPDLRGQPPIRVYFRSLDVDDPAISMLPDSDLDLGPAVADNRGVPGSGTIVYPTSDPWVVLSPSASTAEVQFDTTMQPGDNFRIVTTTSPSWRDILSAYQPSPNGEVRYASGASLDPPEKDSISDVLTVWRTLHLEVDSMTPPPFLPRAAERNFLQGRVVGIGDLNPEQKPTQLDLVASVTIPPLGVADDSPNLDTFGEPWRGRFEKGTIRIGAGTDTVEVRDLLGNGELSVHTTPQGLDLPFTYLKPQSAPVSGFVKVWTESTRQFAVSTSVPQPIAGTTMTVAGTTWPVVSVSPSGFLITVGGTGPLAFHLVDDDASAHPFIPDLSLLAADSDDPVANVFAQAYVRIKYDLTSAGRIPPFVRNVQTDLTGGTYQQQLLRGHDPTTQSAPGFWSGYVQGAFQEDEFVSFFDPLTFESISFVDGDADLENRLGPVLGVTPGLNDVHGSLVFVEAIREFAAHSAQSPPDPPTICPAQAALLSQTPAHEVVHQFGVQHNFSPGAAGLMRDSPCCACVASGMGNYFSGLDLDRIRRR